MTEANQEKALLEAKVEDIFTIAREKNYPKYTSFLNESQVYFVQAYIQKRHYSNYLFYGGCKNNRRLMLGAFPDYMQPDQEDFPIVSLKIQYPSHYELSHRDFLGSIMGLNVKREAVGDMILQPGECSLFVRDSIAPVILQELCKVGRVGVSVSQEDLSQMELVESFQERAGTVSSMRLDAVVALAARVSREKAVSLIQSGMVMVNYLVAQSNHVALKPADILTIRGVGKFCITDEISQTKKGRFHITINQYT